jgi:transmembrane 9 superfamily member 2/4
MIILHDLDDYYYPSFHFCEPEEGVKKQSESLGSILFGDRIFNSPYDVCP